MENAVGQLLSIGRGAGSAERGSYRIDDLAQASGVTVRNIRAYTERGLLPPGERVGRVVWFGESHVARLRVITSLLERGYTSAHIAEMVGAWESGQDLADLLGLAGVIGSAQLPATMDRTELLELVGGTAPAKRLEHAGIIETDGDVVRVVRPDLLQGMAALAEEGITVTSMAAVHERVNAAAHTIASDLLAAGVEQLGQRFIGTEQLTAEQVGDLVGLLVRVRSVTLAAVARTVELALEEQIEDLLSSYLTAYLKHQDGQAG